MTEQLQEAKPLISVVIATRNRAKMLQDSLHSVLCQTYRNLQVIVVDDGSEDDTRIVVEGFGDSRLLYLRQEHRGISAARNLGTDHATGEWIAVHDDDDIMLPFRIEEQMRHVDDDVDFVYGAFINFDDDTGELQLHHGRNYGYGAALMSGFAPGHSTWVARTDIMRLFRYDEGIESAVDNNLVFRMLRSGVRFRHSGVICLLRRVHSGRITNTGGAGQKYVAGMNRTFISRGVPPVGRDQLVKASRRDWGPVDKSRWQIRYLPYLPDHLVKRTGYMSSVSGADEAPSKDAPAREFTLSTTRVESMDWGTFFKACSLGYEVQTVRARLRESEDVESVIAGSEITAQLDAPEYFQDALSRLVAMLPAESIQGYFAVATAAREKWTAEQCSLTAALCNVTGDEQELAIGVVPLRSWQAALALRAAAFSDALSFRVFSMKPQADIAAELSATA